MVYNRQVLSFCAAWTILSGVVFVGSARATDVQVWAAGYEAGQAALTEIWAAGGDGAQRKLGAFPGRPGQMGWSTDGRRVFYRDEPLLAYRMSGAGQQAVPMVDGEVWEVIVSGSAVRRLSDYEMDRLDVAWASAKNGGPKASSSKTLQALERALQTAGMAYNALHQWDFRHAQRLYRAAAQQFEDLAREDGLYSKPMMAYAKMLASHSRMADAEGARWVCREHLGAIGDLILAYKSRHDKLPESLEVLKAWAASENSDDTQLRMLEQMFRSPEDDRADRISYFYRPDAVDGEAMVISPYYKRRLVELIRRGEGFEVLDRAVGQAQVDSMMMVGEHLLEMDGMASVPVLEVVTLMAPKFARGYSRLGYAYLKCEKPDAALASFERSVRLDHRLAEAYNGLGLVYEERPKARYDAIRFYNKALQYDRDYVEARYNMARVRHSLEEHDVIFDVQKVIDIDPTFAPAYLLLGEWYEVQKEDFEQAALYYARYMTLNPDDPEGRKRLANVYLRSRNYERIVALLTDYILEHPDETAVLSVLAQACVQMGRLEWADRYFSNFLAAADEEERMLYEDPRLLMSGEELAAYSMADAEGQEDVVKKFWAAHDPDLTTTINERKLEHYRRVWYALGSFSKGKAPWDRRGEIYIRFGEPDYRSASDMKNFDQSLKVQRVRERIARQIYGQAAMEMSFMGGPVYAVRSLKASLGGGANLGDGYPGERLVANLSGGSLAGATPQRTTEGGESQRSEQNLNAGITAEGNVTDESLELLQFEGIRMDENGALGMGAGGVNDFGFKAVTAQDDASMVPWEVWVYTEVNGGIEITFTDEHMRGEFDYAPPPMDARIPMRQLARFNQFNPRSVAEQAALVTPDYYEPPKNLLPLEFYYDLANFRKDASGEQSLLEVYLGMPNKAGKYLAEQDETNMILERSVALNNARTGAVYRRQGNLVFRSEGDLTAQRGGFIPDLLHLDIAPGTYRMEVQVKDRLSGQQGRYRQEVLIDNYNRDFLQLSELQLAFRIEESGGQGKFSKGNLQVVPIPTRTFSKEQSVFVYYEVYHLQRNKFGQTRYKVEYTIRPKGMQGRKASGVISQLVRVFTGKKQEIAVGYEQLGNTESEEVYMELDLKSAGAGQYVLEVEVMDLNSGLKSGRETGFFVQ